MLRTAGILLAAVLLIAGVVDAATRGMADAHYTSARLTLAGGAPEKGGVPPAALASAIASMRQALALEPSNPHFVEQAARLRESRALGFPPRDPAARDELRQALAMYREAAAMRPGSPYVWASIAMLKVRLNDMDFEFYGALERAGRLGPWEPQVQIAMIDVGLATWRWLALPGKEWVLGAMERGLLRQAPEVKRIAAIHGTLAAVCADFGGRMPRVSALCVRN